jgi:hypothetical protein
MLKSLKSLDLSRLIPAHRPVTPRVATPNADPKAGLRSSLEEARRTVLAEANNYAKTPDQRRDAMELLLNIENDYDRKLGAPRSDDPGLQSLYEARESVMAELNNVAGEAGKPGAARDDALQRLTNIMNAIARAEASASARESSFEPKRPAPVQLR